MAAAWVPDREDAVREVAQAYEFIKIQQPLLLLHCSSSTTTQQLAQSLLSKALRALNVALSVMKQPPAAAAAPVSVVKAEPSQLSPSSPASADSEALVVPSTATARRGSKRSRSSSVTTMEGKKKKKNSSSSSSWVSLTTVPYDDGYEWRKYGEKKINGTLFTRNYFRCTYKDDAGCQATKHVQQRDNVDPPTFQVTYNNDHTCGGSCAAKAAAAAANSKNDLIAAIALLAGCGGNGSGEASVMTTTNSTPTGHAAAAAMDIIKQEPPLQLPPLIEPSAFTYDRTTQFQESLFPASMEQQQFCDGALRDDDDSPGDDIPSATGSSCISGNTCWDGCSGGDMAAPQIAAAEASTGGDGGFLHDLEAFLLCDI